MLTGKYIFINYSCKKGMQSYYYHNMIPNVGITNEQTELKFGTILFLLDAFCLRQIPHNLVKIKIHID